MPARLHHTIVHASDNVAAAAFLARILGLRAPTGRGPLQRVRVANDVTLEYAQAVEFAPQHHAFLLTEDEFDAAYARILDERARYWADPGRTRPAEIDHRHHHGGRGLCVEDPDGNLIEVLTRPAGSEKD
ncbi:MAG: VOC family protein [Acidimicrobiia bacterium]|nr:VOC family protein [Acidimicrobiia bacterium]